MQSSMPTKSGAINRRDTIANGSTAARQPLRIGIDTGGTFTDIVAVDTASGDMYVTKVASTPANPATALVRGVNAILSETGRSADGDVDALAHGTTVATNALLQGEINCLGLIVTAASGTSSRSPASRCRRGTAIPISG